MPIKFKISGKLNVEVCIFILVEIEWFVNFDNNKNTTESHFCCLTASVQRRPHLQPIVFANLYSP